ncbi:MAG: ribosome small subunit-dependent GTPase A [Desulfuromonadaceae bacterium]|nr:ribosome small subunit-dependent GTPase A [Desulfuromonadaceae bacterium]
MTFPVNTAGADDGIIIQHFGVEVAVCRADGSVVTVKVKRNSGHVVGDRVTVQGEVLTRLDRRTVLQRRDVFNKVKPVAANLDVLGIVVAPQPETPHGFIERAVVAARAAGIRPFLLVNKADFAEAAELSAALRQLFDTIEPCLIVSAKQPGSLLALRRFLAECGRAALVGVSGVGKSSLLNALCPGLALPVGDLNEDLQGAHTSSVSMLMSLPDGGELVDTPGFRDFAPVDVSSEDLSHFFPGFLPILEQASCRFRNCRHRQEPGCAITAAVAQGQMSAERYQRYLETLSELEMLEQRLARRR